MKEFTHLTPEMRRARIGHSHARAPDPIPLDWLLAQCSQLERVLRLQFEENELPDEWEAELKALRAAEITTALQRWAYLKHLYRVRAEGLKASEQVDEDAQAAAVDIMRRKPVVVWIDDHRVEVTSRSYSAMAEIAVHDITIRQLREDLNNISELVGEKRAQIRLSRVREPLEREERSRLRTELKELRDLFVRVYGEIETRRAHIYAHALTRHGGPSTDVAMDCPSWFKEVRPEHDGALLAALLEAGPFRWQRLGPQSPRKRGGAQYSEDMGYASLFAAWEKEMKVEAGELFDRDLARVLTQMRAGAIELPDRPEKGEA